MSSTPMRLICTALLGVVASTAFGCADRANEDQLTQREYQAAISDIVDDASKASSLYLDVVAERLPVSTCRSRVGAFEREVRRLIDRVGSLQPPADVVGIQRDFLAAAHDSLDRLQEVPDEVDAGQIACGQQLNERLCGLLSSTRADRAIAELKQRGYLVFGD
jgi:hypothetical protein